jgi:hypothetical protein
MHEKMEPKQKHLILEKEDFLFDDDNAKSLKAKSTALLDNKITTAQKGKRYCCRHHRHHKLVTRKRYLAIEVPTATGGGEEKRRWLMTPPTTSDSS